MTTETRSTTAVPRLSRSVRRLVLVAGVALYVRADASNVGRLGFENELRIPPLLKPREEDGRKVFDLRLQRGRAELLPGKPADTWGANGAYLGPTLRAERGDPVEVRVRNGLPETTTIFVVGRAEDARVVGHAHSEGRS